MNCKCDSQDYRCPVGCPHSQNHECEDQKGQCSLKGRLVHCHPTFQKLKEETKDE